jgi:hypothetical protein
MRKPRRISDTEEGRRPKALQFLTPWWWPVVEAELVPRIASLAAERGSSQAMTAQRVWAVLEFMINQHFDTDSLTMLFPEVAMSNVSPWEIRQIFVMVLKDIPEAVLAQFALECLARVVRDDTLPRLPTWPQAPQSAPADWRSVFSRSTLGPNVAFMRGTHRTHIGFKSYRTAYEHVHLRAVRAICQRYGFVRTSFWTGGPANASSYEDYAAFLDGGLMSKAGDYFWGLHGAWVIGREALRFLCFELGLTTPRWPSAAGVAPSHRDLIVRTLVQLATELPGLRQRLKEYEQKG